MFRRLAVDKNLTECSFMSTASLSYGQATQLLMLIDAICYLPNQTLQSLIRTYQKAGVLIDAVEENAAHKSKFIEWKLLLVQGHQVNQKPTVSHLPVFPCTRVQISSYSIHCFLPYYSLAREVNCIRRLTS